MNTPLAIAHRAGNDPVSIKRAEEAGADMIEADCWLYRRQVELRHEKTAGPLPVLWDRWSLAKGWGTRFTLDEALEAAHPESMLMLDLKGWDRRLVVEVMAIMGDRRYAVTSQNWSLLDAFAGKPEVLRFYSVGSPRLLRALPELARRIGPPLISIHSRFLNAGVMKQLGTHTALVVPWRVMDAAHMEQLLAWGVGGVNVDDLHLIAHVVAGREAPDPQPPHATMPAEAREDAMNP